VFVIFQLFDLRLGSDWEAVRDREEIILRYMLFALAAGACFAAVAFLYVTHQQ
jgi:hypothetical protein